MLTEDNLDADGAVDWRATLTYDCWE